MPWGGTREEKLKKQREYNRLWRKKQGEKNTTYHREYKRKYYKKFPEKVKAINEKYRKAHKKQRNAYSREWNRRNPERLRDRKYRLKYGIGLMDYNKMYEEQQGLCAICKKHLSRLAVDHIHDKTKKVRGLLCGNCNKGLGYMRTPILLQSALKYLEERGYEGNSIQRKSGS